MAVKIEITDASLPPPSPALFRRLSAAAYETRVSQMRRDYGKKAPRITGWIDLPDPLKDDWDEMCRIIYGLLAREGGARARVLREHDGHQTQGKHR